jgi:ADP-heptose:LPS heptosyltransferase
LVKFLIIRFSSIGDIVLTTPVIRGLKQQVDDAEIHFVTKKAFVPVLASNPYIDKVHVLDKSLNELISDLKNEKFDYIIDLHSNLRTSVVKLKLKVLCFTFEKLNIEKWMMVHLKINRLPDGVHIVDRYMATVRPFGVENDGLGLDFFIAPEDEIPASLLPETHQNGYVGLVIGAKHNTKKMPKEKLAKLVSSVQLPVIILGGKDDIDEADYIAKRAGGAIYNACGKYNLGQSASLVKQAKVIIAHDTGLMHIAAAFKKRIVSLWGNTIPQFGMYPYMPDPSSVIFENTGLKCRPCSKIGYQTCPKKHFKCMNEIDLAKVAEKINQLWKA